MKDALRICKDALQYAGRVEGGLLVYAQGVMFSTRSQESSPNYKKLLYAISRYRNCLE
jgi:hypothetical protein